MKFLIPVVAAVAIVSCAGPRAPVASPRVPPAVRLAQCEGPALSLPESLARQIPHFSRPGTIDDRWAELATIAPGGFGGFFYDSTHTAILFLTHPAQADEAERALAGQIGLPLNPTVRQARWDFAQLVGWFDYLVPRLAVRGVIADNDESINRIRFSVTSLAVRDSLTSVLATLPLPCDLVVVDLNGFVVQF